MTAAPRADGALPRVAVVLTQLGYGGAERQTVELLRRLAGQPRAPVLVVCMSDDLEPYGPEITALGYRLEILPRHASFDLVRLARLRALMRRERIALVHAVHLLASGYAWLACWPARSIRVLPSVRGAVAGPGALRSAIYRRMFRGTPRTLVNSHRGARFIIGALGAPPERLAVIPNGVDFAALRERAVRGPLRGELGIAEDAPLVGFVGKDSPVKNVPRFVEIVRRLAARRPELHAVLVGAGLGPEARRRLAPDLPADRVHFLGPRGDVPSVLAGISLLALTSDSEGCPNVVLEALGVGTPVVAADVGDVAAMLREGPGGAVVPRDAIEQYVTEMERWLDLGPAGREAVHRGWPALEREYGMASMVERTVRLWDDVLASGRPTS